MLTSHQLKSFFDVGSDIAEFYFENEGSAFMENDFAGDRDVIHAYAIKCGLDMDDRPTRLEILAAVRKGYLAAIDAEEET